MEKEKHKQGTEKEKSYEIVFNGQTVTKIRTSANLNQAWEEFNKENAQIGDKRAMFPTMFIGYLVAKHKATQIDLKEKVDSKFQIRL